MVMKIYGRAFSVLMKKPLKLWGISLLSVFLVSVGSGLCGVAIPIVGIAVTLLLNTSMTMIYLAGYRGEEVKTVQLFSCFKDWNTIKRVLLGMGWMTLWVTLWSLIPVAGMVIGIIKGYAYRLTPYILVTEPEVSVTEAYKISEQRTKGYKGKMFVADFLIYITIWVVILILGLLSRIRYVGVLFGVISFLFSLVTGALVPLFLGLVQAAFYEEIRNPSAPVKQQIPAGVGTPVYPGNGYQGGYPGNSYAGNPYVPQQPQVPQHPQVPTPQPPQQSAGRICSRCGAQVPADARFCTNCGNPN